MLHAMRAGSERSMGGMGAALSACMMLAALPIMLMTGYTDLVVNLLFDAPLLILPTMFAMDRRVRRGPVLFRRSVLLAGVIGWSVLLADTMIYDLLPLFGVATDAWANTALWALLPLRNGLVCLGFGGWMLGTGILWKIAHPQLLDSIGWLHIGAGIPWIIFGIVSVWMTGNTAVPAALPSLAATAAQVLIPVMLLGYFVWALTLGMWLPHYTDAGVSRTSAEPNG